VRVIEWSTADDATKRALLDRGVAGLADVELRASIRALVDDVRARGDAAVCDALARFDGVEVAPPGLRVSADEIDEARATIGDDVVAAIRDLIDHVRRFNEELARRHGDWRVESGPGLVVGEQVRPIASAGLFVPAGKGSFPSVLGQLGTPAVVAGVPTIVVATPPKAGTGGKVDAAVLVVASELGLTDVFRVNGPAGVAAMAFGTESIPRCLKVVGPGSWPVTLAMMEVQARGCSGVQMLGPSESLILADDSADPVRLAADLLNEAEHGPDSTAVLLTPSSALLDTLATEVAAQLAALPEPRRSYAAAALNDNGGAVLVADLATGCEVANAFAPEHMQLVVRDDERWLGELDHAGEILLGQDTPISMANFVIGCPAALPTSGYAKVSSGITVDAFTKRTAIARANRTAMERLAPSAIALAEHEDFPAHAAAMRRRLR
jgi:histidinol dehydrogenase